MFATNNAFHCFYESFLNINNTLSYFQINKQIMVDIVFIIHTYTKSIANCLVLLYVCCVINAFIVHILIRIIIYK